MGNDERLPRPWALSGDWRGVTTHTTRSWNDKVVNHPQILIHLIVFILITLTPRSELFLYSSSARSRRDNNAAHCPALLLPLTFDISLSVCSFYVLCKFSFGLRVTARKTIKQRRGKFKPGAASEQQQQHSNVWSLL